MSGVRVGEPGGLCLILGEHGVSGAPYHLQVVVAALVRHPGVFIPGGVVAYASPRRDISHRPEAGSEGPSGAAPPVSTLEG